MQGSGFLESACMNVLSKNWTKKEQYQTKTSEKELNLY